MGSDFINAENGAVRGIVPRMNSVFSIEIEKLAFGGAGIGHHEGKVVFVAGAFPGDRVLARVTKEQPRFIEADVAKVETPSPLRRAPACPYVDDCGGCPWMALGYDAQLAAKQAIVGEQFMHIAKLKADVSPCIPSLAELGYRGRIRLHAGIGGDNLLIGYHRARTNDIVNIDRCAVANDGVNRVIGELRVFLDARHADVPDIEEVVIETGYPAARARLRLMMRKMPEHAFAEAMLDAVSGAAGLSIASGHDLAVYGEDILSVNIGGGIALEYGPTVFSQVNPGGNRLLVEKTKKLAAPAKGKTALDLYCGMGNLVFPLAAAGMNVTGVEHSRFAVEDAEKNAARLNLAAEFMAGDAIRNVQRMTREKRMFDTVLLDPPRAGAKGIGKWLNQLAKERVVYVSCNPSSLARDAKDICENGFALVSAQPLDMFPNTFHVETVALFERR